MKAQFPAKSTCSDLDEEKDTHINYLKSLISSRHFHSGKSTSAVTYLRKNTGDMAYGTKANLEYFNKKEFPLYAKLNPIISEGQPRKHFGYNKDGGKKKQKANQVETYYFDIEKCKVCPLSENCYKRKAKSKTYSVSILSQTHQNQKDFQETELFKAKMKHRYEIEAKHAELKNRHGYGIAQSKGFFGMDIQGATILFLVNLK
ncbi:hypothetical protein RyT2_07090 [Pseudolactococcus yaeyamensis]